MTSAVEKAFLYAAHDLSHAAPGQWEAFREALGALAVSYCIDIADAPPTAEAHIAQGRARVLLGLRDNFSKLAERVEKLRTAEARQRAK